MKLNFIYCGRRWLVDARKMAICVRPVNPDGTAMPEQLFAHHRKADRATIGGVYSGAQFTDTGATGLVAALVTGWDGMSKADFDSRIEWQAKDKHAKAREAAYKAEQDARKADELESIMRPLRERYEACRVRRDHAGMAALEYAVVAALKTTPRKGK